MALSQLRCRKGDLRFQWFVPVIVADTRAAVAPRVQKLGFGFDPQMMGSGLKMPRYTVKMNSAASESCIVQLVRG